jgi:hypothetical protein
MVVLDYLIIVDDRVKSWWLEIILDIDEQRVLMSEATHTRQSIYELVK